jgi:hypothetical protein
VSSRRWLTGWRERQDAIAIILKAAKREGLSAVETMPEEGLEPPTRGL